MSEGDDHRNNVTYIHGETDVDRIRNSIVGAALMCTFMVCVTAVVCTLLLR